MNLVSRAEILALDQAAAVVSSALTAKGHRHAFLGGYAVCLIGGARSTLVTIVPNITKSLVKGK